MITVNGKICIQLKKMLDEAYKFFVLFFSLILYNVCFVAYVLRFHITFPKESMRLFLSYNVNLIVIFLFYHRGINYRIF